MGIPVLLIGRSGSGKSASLRNFANNEYGFINVMGKKLPFKSDKKYAKTISYPAVKSNLLAYATKTDCIVIDDAGYLITDEFMRKGEEKGYAKFTEMASNFYNLLMFIQKEMESNIVVYIFMHEEIDDLGYVKPKTIGKLLDEKIDIAGMFTIVLNANKKEGKYIFRTQTDGFDVTKSPIGMFESEEIDNDLKVVQNKIKEYYGL